MELTKPGLDILQPAWKDVVPASVDALFTCRDGGVSSGAYGNADGIMGLNVAPHTGDFGACVNMNRNIVAQLVPTDPVWMKQVHGTTVVDADTVGGEPEADAAVSTKPGVVCTVMTADCLPVLITNVEGTVVAAVHAGWKSLADGIIQKTIRVMRERAPESTGFIAWLAPRIGPESFEVGQDVLDAMLQHLPNAKDAFTPGEGDRWMADLAKLARMALAAEDVKDEQIVDCDLSTYAHPRRFYSYRRDGEKSGRHAAMIWIKPTE